jgi:hypothetical protein
MKTKAAHELLNILAGVIVIVGALVILYCAAVT